MNKLSLPVRFYRSLVAQIRTNKVSFTVWAVLRGAVIFVIIRSVLQQRWENVFVGVLALLLFMIPPFLEKNFRIEIPTVLESIAYIFVFCAEILGEIEAFYVKVPFWDTMLHTVNGFIFAAFGFCLCDLFNRNPRFKFQLSPLFLSLMAFCFSMTVGTLWEFFEYTMDTVFSLDMQKDFLLNDISSIVFDPNGGNTPIKLENITSTVINLESGESVVVNGGYLDIGLKDTIKDLFVNYIGAFIFSIAGYFYIKQRGKGRFAESFIPVLMEDEAVSYAEASETDVLI